MDILNIINEEIVEYIKRLDKQKKEVNRAIQNVIHEEDDEKKIEKEFRVEREKQKLFSLQAEFLKEKIVASKEKQKELHTRLKIIKDSRTQ